MAGPGVAWPLVAVNGQAALVTCLSLPPPVPEREETRTVSAGDCHVSDRGQRGVSPPYTLGGSILSPSLTCRRERHPARARQAARPSKGPGTELFPNFYGSVRTEPPLRGLRRALSPMLASDSFVVAARGLPRLRRCRLLSARTVSHAHVQCARRHVARCACGATDRGGIFLESKMPKQTSKVSRRPAVKPALDCCSWRSPQGFAAPRRHLCVSSTLMPRHD